MGEFYKKSTNLHIQLSIHMRILQEIHKFTHLTVYFSQECKFSVNLQIEGLILQEACKFTS